MPSFKSLCPRQVRFIGSQFLPPTARHYKIQIWPGTSEKVGAGREVTSSNQDSRNNVATLVCIIIKFPYNAHSDWLKQRTLSEYKRQVNDIKLAFKFLLRNFDKFDLN